MKSQKTKDIEGALANHLSRLGLYGVPEVSLDGDPWIRRSEKQGIVDYITVDTHGIIRCYEIKVSMADFRSSNKVTFVGDYNYYVVPNVMAQPVLNALTDPAIGIISVGDDLTVRFYKKAQRKIPQIALARAKEAMFRAACREVDKQMGRMFLESKERLERECAAAVQNNQKNRREK